MGRLLLLVFKGNSYFENAIAVHSDGNMSNLSLSNLKWGTRKLQTKIAMKNPINKTRITELGRKFGKIYWTENFITDGKVLHQWKLKNGIRILQQKEIVSIKNMLAENISPTQIAQKLNINRSTVYRHRNENTTTPTNSIS